MICRSPERPRQQLPPAGGLDGGICTRTSCLVGTRGRHGGRQQLLVEFAELFPAAGFAKASAVASDVQRFRSKAGLVESHVTAATPVLQEGRPADRRKVLRGHAVVASFPAALKQALGVVSLAIGLALLCFQTRIVRAWSERDEENFASRYSGP